MRSDFTLSLGGGRGAEWPKMVSTLENLRHLKID